jgi:hypothetical protein
MSKKNKKEIEKITVSLSQETLDKLEKGNYNKSKLIDELLSKHFEDLEKKEK